MCSTSIFSCIMTMISNLLFFIFQIFIFIFFLTNIADVLHFHLIFVALSLTTLFFFSLKLIIFIVCSLKNSKSFFIQYLLLYTSSLFYMLLNEDVVDIEKPVGISSLTFVADEFSWLFLHPSIFSTIHSKCVIPLNNVDSFLTVR